MRWNLWAFLCLPLAKFGRRAGGVQALDVQGRELPFPASVVPGDTPEYRIVRRERVPPR